MNCICGATDVPVGHFIVGHAGSSRERPGHGIAEEMKGEPVLTHEEKLRAEAFEFGYLRQGARSALGELEGLSVAKLWVELAGDDWQTIETLDAKTIREKIARVDWRIEEAKRILRESLETGERRGKDYAKGGRGNV